MHQSTHPVEYIYLISLFFKLNFKYMGLQDVSYSLDIAFTLILYFTLWGSTCSGAVPSPQFYESSIGHHFNKHLHISNSRAVLGLVGLFQDFLQPLWADSIKKKYYTGWKDYMSFLNGPSNGVKCKGRSSWTKKLLWLQMAMATNRGTEKLDR